MIYCPDCDIKHMDKARHDRFHTLVDALETNHGEEYASVARRLFREEAMDCLTVAASGVGARHGATEQLFANHDIEDLAAAVADRYDSIESRREELEEIRAGKRPMFTVTSAEGRPA